MKCRDCRWGKHHGPGSVNCVLYGMILSAGHECTLEREIQINDYNDGGEGEAEIHEDSGGIVIQMPGMVSGSET